MLIRFIWLHTLIVTGLLDFHWTSGGWSSTGCCSLRPLESVFCKFRRWWAGLPPAESFDLMLPWWTKLDDSDCRWLNVKPCQVSKERMRTIAKANPAMAATNLSFSFMSSFLLRWGPKQPMRRWWQQQRRRQRHFPTTARLYRNLAFSQILMQQRTCRSSCWLMIAMLVRTRLKKKNRMCPVSTRYSDIKAEWAILLTP